MTFELRSAIDIRAEQEQDVLKNLKSVDLGRSITCRGTFKYVFLRYYALSILKFDASGCGGSAHK
jgi:hypothetical protein